VSALWGSTIDYVMLHKSYGTPSESEQRRYSPAECTGIEKRVMSGDPDLDLASTSYVERQNLTMRMGMRRDRGTQHPVSAPPDHYCLGGAVHASLMSETWCAFVPQHPPSTLR
jgi:hypothetical protein